MEYGTCCVGSGCNDWSAGVWDGTTWAAIQDLDGEPGVAYTNQAGSFPVGVGWLSGQAVAAYSHSGTLLNWAKWTAAGGWVLQSPATTSPPLAQQVNFTMVHLPATGVKPTESLALFIEDISGAVWSKRYDGQGWLDMNAGSSLAIDVQVQEGLSIQAILR
jgi:hypothetical protein